MYGTLKNASSTELAVPSFGVVLPAGDSLDLMDVEDLQAIRMSIDLNILLMAGTLEIYDDTPTLIAPGGSELWMQAIFGTRPRFEAYNAADSVAYNTDAVAAQPLDTTSIETPAIILAPENAHIDINFDGAIDIQAEISVACDSGTGMSGMESWLAINGVFVPGTLRATVLHEGEASSICMGRSSLAVAVGDEITIVSQRTSGSLAWRYPASGCRLRIRRVE